MRIKYCGIHCTKFELILKAILMIQNTRKWTRFCENKILGKGFRKTSADSFLKLGGNSEFCPRGGRVWEGILAEFFLAGRARN